MIAVEEAERIVLNNLLTLDTEEIDLDNCLGRILSEDIIADRDFPPFNRVMMDGIAIDHKAFVKGERKFKVEGIQPAGSSQKTLLNQGDSCLEVMTGAMLPKNTDAVIRYEDIEFINEDTVKINLDEVKPFQNIHLQGTDRKSKSILIQRGVKISPAEIAIMATVGKSKIRVKYLPKIALVSTGDELVNINETPHPYQIRKSNTHALKVALDEIGLSANTFHFIDENEIVEQGLKEVVSAHDVIILSGGVSKGKKDYVPEVLEKIGVNKLFHKVKQRPGKPFWFGTVSNEKVIFALPGNPVSTFMCFYKYIKPWIFSSLECKVKSSSARLSEDFAFAPEFNYYLQVKLEDRAGETLAVPVKGHGSGDLANLLEADAFLELPPNKSEFKKGESYPTIVYR